MKFSAHDIDTFIHAIEVMEDHVSSLVHQDEFDGWPPNYHGIEEVRYTIRRLREMENEARNEVFPV